MRRPHVFERSAPRLARGGYQEVPDRASAARLISAQIAKIIDKAEQAGLSDVAKLLEKARLEAEKDASF